MLDLNPVPSPDNGKPKRHPKCKGYQHYNFDYSEFECEYGSNLTCEDCKYGPCGGRKDPAAKCNRD